MVNLNTSLPRSPYEQWFDTDTLQHRHRLRGQEEWRDGPVPEECDAHIRLRNYRMDRLRSDMGDGT